MTLPQIQIASTAMAFALAGAMACDRESEPPAPASAGKSTTPGDATANTTCADFVANAPRLRTQQQSLAWRTGTEPWPLCADVSAKLAAKAAPLERVENAPTWTVLDLSQGMAGFAAEGSIELLFSAAREQSNGIGGICGFKDRPVACRQWAEYAQHRNDFAPDGRSADLAAAIRTARTQTASGPSAALVVTEGISDQRTDEHGKAARVAPDVASAAVAVALAEAVSEDRGVWLALVSAPFAGKVYLGATERDLPPGSRCREFVARKPWYQLAASWTAKALQVDCDGEMALAGYRGPRTLMVIGISSPGHHREFGQIFQNMVKVFQAKAKALFATREKTRQLGSLIEPVQLAPRTHELQWTSSVDAGLVARRARDHQPRLTKQRGTGQFVASCSQHGGFDWTLTQPAAAKSHLPAGYLPELRILLDDHFAVASGGNLRDIKQATGKTAESAALAAEIGAHGMRAAVNCDVAVSHRSKFVDGNGRMQLRAVALARLATSTDSAALGEKEVIAGLPPGLRAALEPAGDATTATSLSSSEMIAAPWQIPSLRRFIVGLHQAADNASMVRLQQQAEGTRGCIAGCSMVTLVVPERIEQEDQIDDGCSAPRGTRGGGGRGWGVGLLGLVAAVWLGGKRWRARGLGARS